ncbi:MAG: glycosyltransferase [Arthrobacter oryzae]
MRDAISRAGPTGRINFAGMLDGDALDAAYCSSDLFVMPSLYEGYGMALTGAMAHGLPRVSTGGAAARTVPHGTGIKAPSAGAAALSGLSPAGAERTR